jgi:prepilin-type N-terminal cleavage/methylation domain-containing protein
MTALSASVPERRGQRGFTLTELAVVFTIVALLLASAMYTLSAQTEGRNIVDTQRRLEDAKELLVAFAIVNGRLPCPASSTSNGDEAPTGGGACTNAYAGFLPAKAIGFTPVDTLGYGVDVWGSRIRYAVSVNSNAAGALLNVNPDNVFTTAPASPSTGIKYNFNPTTTTTLTPLDLLVCSSYGSSGNVTTTGPSCGASGDSPPGIAVTNASTVVAVVWSQGKNLVSASYSGTTGQAGEDEKMNNKTSSNSNHGVFIHHPPRPFSETNEFDDHLVWIPVGLLYGRMITAGTLP